MAYFVAVLDMVPRRCILNTPALIFATLFMLPVGPAGAANFSCGWSAAASGTWNVAGNWSSCNSVFPNNNGDTFDATIDATGAAYTVTLNSTATIGSFTLNSTDASFNQTGGTFNVLNSFAATSGAYILSGGTLDLNGANGTLNTFTQTGGTLAGSGTVTVSGLTTLTNSLGLTGSGALNTDGGLLIDGTGTKTFSAGRTLNTDGMTTWLSSTLDVFNSGVTTITNAATGTWDAQGDNLLRFRSGSGHQFNNAGLFKKSAGVGTTMVGIGFVNSGMVDVQSGTLRLHLAGGETSTGDFDSDAGTTLEFSAFGPGTHTVSGSITGAHTRFLAGTTDLQGSYNVSEGTTVAGGTVTFGSAVVDLGTTLTVSGGTGNFNSAVSADADAMVISAGTANVNTDLVVTTLDTTGGTLAGSGTVTVSGLTTLTNSLGLTGSGALNTDGGLLIDGTGTKTFSAGRTLNTDGMTTWLSSTLDVFNSGVTTITNAATGTWDAQGDNLLRFRSGSGHQFNNAGLFKKSAGVGTTMVGIGFVNSGMVDVQSGTLRLHLAGGETSTGDFDSDAGTTLEFSAFGPGTHTVSGSITGAHTRFLAGTTDLQGSYSVSEGTTVAGGTVTFGSAVVDLGTTLTVSGGTGNFNSAISANTDAMVISGGTANVNTDLVATTLDTTGGTLAGSGTVTVSGLTTLTNSLGLTGSGVLNTEGGLSIDGNGTKTFSAGRALNTDGMTTWLSSTLDVFNSGVTTITNAATGTWDAQGDNLLRFRSGSGHQFNNAGLFKKSAGVGTTTVGIGFVNSGMVDVQSGTLRLHLAGGETSTGDFDSDAGTTLEFSAFGPGTHTVSGSITGAHTRFLAGTTDLQGSYNVSEGTTVAGGTVTFGSAVVDLGTTLTVSGGTGNFNSAVSANTDAMVISAGTANVNTDLVVTTLDTTGGTLAGSGTVTVSGLTTLTNSLGLTGSGVLNTEGGLLIDGTGTKTFSAGRTLNTDGMTTWLSSTLDVFNSGVTTITNAATGTWDAQGDNLLRFRSGSGHQFNNAGLFKKSAGVGTTMVGIGFVNSGMVDVQSGTLRLHLAGGETSTGDFDSDAGTTLEFSAFGPGTHTVSGSITGAHTRFLAGTTDLQGSYNVSEGTTVAGGTVTFGSAVVDLGTTLTVSGGTGNFNSAVSADADAMVISAGTANVNTDLVVTTLDTTGGTLAGSGTVTVSGLTTLTNSLGLTGSGVLNTEGGLLIDGTGTKTFSAGRTLNTDGMTTWLSSTLDVFNSGVTTITNAATGTWDAQGDNLLRFRSGSGHQFNNAGLFKKSAGVGTTTVGIGFVNSGTVDVQSGTLRLHLAGGETSTGDFDSDAGTTLEFSAFGAGTHTVSGSITGAHTRFLAGTTDLQGSYSVSEGTTVAGGTVTFGSAVVDLGTTLTVSGGTGNFNSAISANTDAMVISAGTANANTDLVATTLDTTGGTLAGSGTVTVSGLTTLTNSLGLTGSGVLNTEGGLLIDGNGTKTFSAGRTLNTDGMTTWLSSTLDVFNSGVTTITNAATGTWDAQGDNLLRFRGGSGHQFNNAGLFKKSAGVGTTTVGIGFVNSGTVDVQSGTLSLTGDVNEHDGNSLTGGTWKVADGAILNLNESGAVDITINQGDVTLSGTNSTFARINALTDNQGKFKLLDGRDFAATGAFANSGELQLGGGQFSGGAVNTATTGTVKGFGSIVTPYNNDGTTDVAGGTLILSNGGSQNGGTLKVALGAELRLAGGTHDLTNLGASEVVGSIAIASGIVNQTGTLNSNGHLDLSGGTLSVAGTPMTASYDQSGGSLSGTGDLTVNGPGLSTWSHGPMTGSGETIFAGSLSIEGSNAKELDAGRLLRLQGSTTWIGTGDIDLDSTVTSGFSTIAVEGVFDAQNNQSIGSSFGGGVFDNSGTFKKTNSFGTTTVARPLNNSGTVDVQTGTLSLNGGGISSGNFQGAGTLQLGGGTHMIDGIVSIANLNISSGAATFIDSVDVSSLFSLGASANTTLDGGSLTFTMHDIDGSFNFVEGSVKSLSDLTIGDLDTALDLTANKSLEVVGVSTINALESLTLNGGVFTTGSLVNNGTFIFNSGLLNNNSVLVVGPSGPFGDTLTVNPNARLVVDLGPPSDPQNPTSSIIVETASLLVIDGEVDAGTRRLSNSGDVVLGGPAARVKGGQLFLSSGGELRGEGRVEAELVSSGTITAEAGKRIEFSQPSTSPGTLMMDGGTLDFEQALTNPNGGGGVTGNGQLIAQGGLNNEGAIDSNGGSLEIISDVTNSGTVTVFGGSDLTINGTFQHNGMLSIFDTANFIGDFVNAGSLLRVEGQAVFGDAYSGNGPLSGLGSIFFNGVTNAGNSPGVFEFGGDSSFGNDHELMIELAGLDPESQFDRWQIGGRASLDGTLKVVLLDGYRPTDGDTFEFFSAQGGIFGAFDAVLFPELAGFAFAYAQSSNALSFSVNAAPVPVPTALWLFGSALLFLMRKQRLIRISLLGAALGLFASTASAVPGDPHCLSFPGDFTFTNQMVTEIGGVTPCTQHDQFAAGGTLTINGATMEVILIDDYVPNAGDTFQVLSFGALGGTGFANIDLSQAMLPEPLSWNTDNLLLTGELQVVAPLSEHVPVPTWALVALIVLLGAAIWGRRSFRPLSG